MVSSFYLQYSRWLCKQPRTHTKQVRRSKHVEVPLKNHPILTTMNKDYPNKRIKHHCAQIRSLWFPGPPLKRHSKTCRPDVELLETHSHVKGTQGVVARVNNNNHYHGTSGNSMCFHAHHDNLSNDHQQPKQKLQILVCVCVNLIFYCSKFAFVGPIVC